ncbi:MAG TPA: PD-(D/E)XK nuclease-like domain-containing protein [Verrucomicrobiae bacterium]|nr:PD-(D/E)XK nuclease-like domain-containing protein [Verrucomicrobiae bacterium]
MHALEFRNRLINAKIVGENVEPEAYHRPSGRRGEVDFVMSRSELMEFDYCPWRWIRGFKDTGNASTEWGSIMDNMVMSPEKCDEIYVVCPETYPDTKTGEPKPWNWNAKYCKQWRDERAGKEPIKANDFKDAKVAFEALIQDELIADIILNSRKQVMVVAEYRDEATAITIPIKTLLDLVPSLEGLYPKSLADFKTACSIGHAAWDRAVFDHRYYVQSALYLDAYVAATKEDRVDFRHIVQENYQPWDTGRRLVSEEFINLGRGLYQKALKRYCQCLKTDIWPGHDDKDDNGRISIEGWTLVQPKDWMVLAQ